MYFDLNERSRAGRAHRSRPSPANSDGTISTTRAADDAVPAANAGPGGAGGADMPLGEQLAMYVFIVLGVLFAPIMNLLAQGTALPKELVSLPIIIGSLVVGFFIIPAIWEKVGAKQDAPLIVRLALFFQNGVFWQAALGTIYAAAAKASGNA